MGLISTIVYYIKNMRRANRIRKTDRNELLNLSDEDFYETIFQYVCEGVVIDINDTSITNEQRNVYSLLTFEMEINNGGLCQFFVNSSRECAPFISDALTAIGETKIKNLYNQFVIDNSIDLNDLSSFAISSIDEYSEQVERFDFDSFDDKYYEDSNIHQLIINYARNNIDNIIC